MVPGPTRQTDKTDDDEAIDNNVKIENPIEQMRSFSPSSSLFLSFASASLDLGQYIFSGHPLLIKSSYYVKKPHKNLKKKTLTLKSKPQ